MEKSEKTSGSFPMYGGVRQKTDPGCCGCNSIICWADGIPITCGEMLENMESESRCDDANAQVCQVK